MFRNSVSILTNHLYYLLLASIFFVVHSAQAQQKSIDSLRDSLALSQGITRAEVLTQLSWNYRNVNADSALYFGKLAFTLSEELNYEAGAIKSLNFMGIAYRNKSDYSSAFEYFVRALKLAEEVEDQTQIGYSNINIGNIYIYQTNYEGALEYFKKALIPAIAIQDKNMQAYIYLNLGRTYSRMDKFDQAEHNYIKTQVLRRALKDHQGLATIAVDLAELTRRKGDLKQSLVYFHESLAAIQQANNHGALTFSLHNMGKVFLEMGHLDSAEFYTSKALKIATENGLKNDLRKIQMTRSQLAEQKGDYKSALAYHKLYQVNEDSIFNEQSTRTIENLKSGYEAEKKEAETHFLRELVERQRTIIFLAIAITSLLLLIVFIIYRRVVERRKMNFKIAQQAKKLKEIDSAKSRFFANISHDLRSPLSLILGNFEAVINSQDSYLTDKAKSQLDTAHKNAERLLFLTDEINELTTLENGEIKLKKKLVPVVPFLSALLKIFSTSASYKNITLDFAPSIENEICIDMDPNQFEKIIFNLISNALKHTQEGDRIQLTADMIGTRAVSIKIIDSGEGIEATHLPYLFDRYYQSPKNKYHVYEGLGIGLALVKELVDVHDGTIEVTSTLGEGASFNMTFPIQTATSNDTDLPVHSESLLRKNELWRELWEKTYQPDRKVDFDLEKHEKNETILLVDDHPEVREFIAGLISAQYHVLEAENGLKALEVLGTNQIDLVITDLMMPWMDGFELLEKMKSDEKLSAIPVLVVSARNSAEDQFEVLKKGINNIIQKPFSHEEILMKIENLLSQKKHWTSDDANSLIVDDKPLMSDLENELLDKVKQLILDQIDNPDLTVLVLADAMAASERKVYRMIKKLTGMTPHEYIKEIRWLYIEKLIKNKTLKNATEAARCVGMKNVTNFKKQFLKRFNRSLDESIAK